MIWWQREGPAQVAKRIAVNQALRSDRAFEILRRLAGARQGRWDDPESLRKNSAAYSREIFARLAREISRVLIPGGVTAHAVDVNDHRDYEHPLEFLSIPHRVWDAMYSRKSSYHNRHRASQFRLAFGTVFEATDIRPTHQLSRAAVGDPRRFAPGFRELDVEDLAIVEFVLVARKQYVPLAQS